MQSNKQLKIKFEINTRIYFLYVGSIKQNYSIGNTNLMLTNA